MRRLLRDVAEQRKLGRRDDARQRLGNGGDRSTPSGRTIGGLTSSSSGSSAQGAALGLAGAVQSDQKTLNEQRLVRVPDEGRRSS
jgi:hypothetical protein